MKHEAGTRLTLRHENGSILIGESNGFGQLMVGKNGISISDGWEVVSAAPPVNPEPRGTMARVQLVFPGAPSTYTYLGHKSGSRWSWTGSTAPSGNWVAFLQWAKSKGAEVVSVDQLEVDLF